MIWALLLIPAFFGFSCFIVRSNKIRRTILVLSAFVHLCLTVASLFKAQDNTNEWLYLDSLGLIFLLIMSFLFFGASIYAVAYLNEEEKGFIKDIEEGFLFKNVPEAVFSGCLLLFLSSMTLVTVSRHFGLLWIGMETTTLMSAPLIYYHRSHRSLEATWKYLLICSVGIALGLLGNVFLTVATSIKTTPFLINNLIQLAPTFNVLWLKTAFLFFFVGYGTKMGLAPLHTWLPDAHSEAPSLVSSLLSGALLNCAFLSLLRVYQVCVAAKLLDFMQEIFLVFGLFSLLIAAIFIFRQKDFKRMLAYSSVEHMGILAFGMGIGPTAFFATLLHSINHSLTKSSLFLTSGNILRNYKTKNVNEIQGMLKKIPWNGCIWLLGFFAITGTPPTSMFLSKFWILKSTFEKGFFITGFLFLGLLILIFIGMALIFLKMTQGNIEPEKTAFIKEKSMFFITPLVFISLVYVLGIYFFPFLTNLLTDASAILAGAK